MRRRGQKGQALVMVALALGLVLIGAVGLAIDTSQLYAHRQMAQAAADAAAQAAILSIFNGTNVGTNAFADSTSYSHTCGTGDVITPCSYARKNGFGSTADDTVFIDIPTAADAGLDPGILSVDDPVNLIRVTITRSVSTWFIRILGAAPTANIKASAVAACLRIPGPIPIAVLHPTLSQALYTNSSGNKTMIKICGGPAKSIQVNSVASDAYRSGGGIDLSHAGPADDGSCSTGTGGDFGVFGGPTTNPGSVALGSTGRYISPASRTEDPYAQVKMPGTAGGPPKPANNPAWTAASGTDINNGIDGCNVRGCTKNCCTEYSPGLYSSLNITKGNPVIFKPGLYYIQGNKGFTLKNVDGGGGSTANYDAMCVGCSPDPNTGAGMVVFDTGPAGSTLGSNPSGGFTIDTGVQITLKGSTLTTTNPKGKTVAAGPYYGMLFFEDRTANAHTGNNGHTFGKGNGCFSLIGNIYVTNRMDIMSDPNHYQQVTYHGTPCSTTVQKGNIIVSALELKGDSAITMNLEPNSYLTVRRVALVQ